MTMNLTTWIIKVNIREVTTAVLKFQLLYYELPYVLSLFYPLRWLIVLLLFKGLIIMLDVGVVDTAFLLLSLSNTFIPLLSLRYVATYSLKTYTVWIETYDMEKLPIEEMNYSRCDDKLKRDLKVETDLQKFIFWVHGEIHQLCKIDKRINKCDNSNYKPYIMHIELTYEC